MPPPGVSGREMSIRTRAGRRGSPDMSNHIGPEVELLEMAGKSVRLSPPAPGERALFVGSVPHARVAGVSASDQVQLDRACSAILVRGLGQRWLAVSGAGHPGSARRGRQDPGRGFGAGREHQCLRCHRCP